VTEAELSTLRNLRGAVSTVCTTGQVEHAYSRCLANLRSFHDRNGFHTVEYKDDDARLVEAGRDAIVEHMLRERYDYVVMIDADATFQHDAVVKLLHTAFIVVPQSDMVGAYVQLKGSHLSAADTGTGRWEAHFPGEGVIPVIRTGGHFFLCKRSAFEKTGFKGPWFRTRRVPPAIQAFAEVDGFARQHFSGRNPLTEHEAWEEMIDKARPRMEPGNPNPVGMSTSGVGEDSAFCDLLKSKGGQIFVDTNVVTGHIAKYIIGPEKLKEEVNRMDRRYRLSCGVYE
jgi:hypothetical protein